ncbi:MAG: DUF4402 domain-containing protein [Pseudomonadales bacterium]|nr:DUF4402 domain-containing protein [Pseudomonadales bacterium]
MSKTKYLKRRENIINKTLRSNKIAKIAAIAGLGLGLGVVAGVQATGKPFQATLRILIPCVITEVRALDFGDTEGGNVDITIAPTDPTAAVSSATGQPNKYATASILQSSVTMLRSGGNSPDEIVVDTFTLGGDDISGSTVDMGASGSVSDMRVGPTAHVLAEDVAGDYSGTATFSLLYQ